jgi:hypothetical protein
MEEVPLPRNARKRELLLRRGERLAEDDESGLVLWKKIR